MVGADDVVVIKRSHQLVKRRDWAQGLSEASREQEMRYSEHLTLISATLVFHTLRFRWHRHAMFKSTTHPTPHTR